MRAPFREMTTDAWLRRWDDGHVEIVCKTPGYRVRVYAPEEQAIEVVEMFERWTGHSVNVGQRLRRAPSVPPGQLSMTDA